MAVRFIEAYSMPAPAVKAKMIEVPKNRTYWGVFFVCFSVPTNVRGCVFKQYDTRGGADNSVQHECDTAFIQQGYYLLLNKKLI